MKLIHIIFMVMLVGCGAAVANQPVPAANPENPFGTKDGTDEAEILWDLIAEQAFIIEALKGEIIALQESGGDYGYVYEVEAGQSLWIIADEVLGDPYRWITIYTLNNYWMDDPDLIYPRQILLLP